MYVVSEGDNRHGMPITRDAVIASAETILMKPLLFKFNSATQDFMQHEVDQIACGTTSYTKEDYYFKEIDGKLWLVVKAYIWKMYFEEVVNVFMRDKEKAISMEMLIVDSEVEEDDETLEKETITSFCFTGVTLLGNMYNPAIVGANAEVIKYSKESFSQMLEQTKELLFSNKGADTNNNQVKEANEVAEKVKFNKEEFAKNYSLTANDMFEKFQLTLNACKYSEGEYECRKYYVRDFCGTYVYARDYEEDAMVAIPYSFSEKNPSFDFTNVKYARLTYVVDEEKQGDMVQTYADELVNEAVAKCNEDSKAKITEFEAKVTDLESAKTEFEATKAEFETKNSELTSEVETFTEKVKTLEAEKTELVTFKENVEKQAREQKINYAVESVKENLTDKQISEWKEKVEEFESVESFTNAIQAYAYTQTKNIPAINEDQEIKIHIPQPNTDNNKGLWD